MLEVFCMHRTHIMERLAAATAQQKQKSLTGKGIDSHKNLYINGRGCYVLIQ